MCELSKDGAIYMTTAVILAGGLGTRISEETHLRPKPMIEIGGKPIVWHIMKIYAAHGIRRFILCCGYKGYMIKEYFANYLLHSSDLTIDLSSNKMNIHHHTAEPWTVTLVDTGENTMTGGRLKRVSRYLNPDEPFCFTYGDGVGNVDISSLLAFHISTGCLATLTAANPPGRFGALQIEDQRVKLFNEKPLGEGGLVNAGFFVLSPQVLKYISGDQTSWEREPLERLATEGQLAAFDHFGFWQPMDTLRDKTLLEDLWQAGNAPWKVWS